jgi:hypothetical protein
MLFNLFGEKEKEPDDRLFIDKVFISAGGKLNACMDLAKLQPDTLFIAWFSETARIFRDAFIQNNLDEKLIAEAGHVYTAQMTNHKIVFLEHYPLLTKETEFAENWNLNNCRVYSSMDEPLFKHFGSEKMLPLIKLLGMKENEPIEHSFVSQSIHKGQQKIAALVSFEQTGSSQEEWMKRNVAEG